MEAIFVLLIFILGWNVQFWYRKCKRYQQYFDNEPCGRVGIMEQQWEWTIPSGEKDKKVCVFEIEEIDLVESEITTLSKVRILSVETKTGSTARGLTENQRKELYQAFSVWVPTKMILWKKPSEQLLTHQIPEVRARARYKIENRL